MGARELLTDDEKDLDWHLIMIISLPKGVNSRHAERILLVFSASVLLYNFKPVLFCAWWTQTLRVFQVDLCDL